MLQAYDVAACKFRGREALTNFPVENYDGQREQLAQVRPVPEQNPAIQVNSRGIKEDEIIWV